MPTQYNNERGPSPINGERPRKPTTAQLTNDGQHLRMDTGDDVSRSACSIHPPLIFSNTRCRCHIAVSDVATKQRTMTKNHHSSLLGHHGKYPPWFVPTHLAQTQHDNGPTTWDNDDVARTGTMTMTRHNDEAAPRRRRRTTTQRRRETRT